MQANNRPLKVIETLAEQLLLLESDDRSGLELLRTEITELRNVLPEGFDADATQMLDASFELVGKVIAHDPTTNADGVLQAIAEILKAMQPVFRDNSDFQCDNDLLIFFGLSPKTTFKLPSSIDPQMFADYLSSQPTNLDDFEEYLVRIERDSNPEDINAFRRLIHTLKGESGLLGITAIERLCHVMEDNLRVGKLSETLYDDFYKALDWLRATFAAIGRNEPYEDAENLIQKFVNFSGRDSLAALEKSKKITGSAIPEPAPKQSGQSAQSSQPATTATESLHSEPAIVTAEPEALSDDTKSGNDSKEEDAVDPFAILETLESAEASSPIKSVPCRTESSTSATPAANTSSETPSSDSSSTNSSASENSADASTSAVNNNLPVLAKRTAKSATKRLAQSGGQNSALGRTGGAKPIAPKADAAPKVATPPVAMVLPENVDYEVFVAFVAGQTTNMEDLEQILLRLERSGSGEDVNALRGLLHTLKGDSALMGLEEIEKLCHAMEDSLENGFPSTISDAFFSALDWLRGAFLALNSKQSINSPRELTERFERSAGKIEPPSTAVATATVLEDLENKKITTEKPVILNNLFKPRQRPPASAYPRPLPKVAKPATDTTAAPEKKVATPIERAPISQAAKIIDKEENLSTSGGMMREMVRVDADRLDRLLDTIGELVIAESMVAQSVHQALSTNNHATLVRQIGDLGKITRTLQEAGMSLRMTAIRGVFNKMDRLVRDLSHKSGKNVRLMTKGEDTELDKSLIERISDLLVHMVRNSMDHGIEDTAAEREKTGKPAVGSVTLHAYHKGGNVCLDISDDGRGLDRDAILAKAVERKLIAADATGVSDNDIFKLIFEPGFSTAKKITDISGRGVGMDVVKRNIDSMRGRIEITSAPGVGTQFSIRLPLTLAIIDGMVVRVAKERYIIPTLSILHSVQLQKKDVVMVVGRGEMIRDEDMELPMFRLSSLLNTRDAIEDIGKGIVLIVEADERRIGILCDEILEQQQIVIKSLGDYLAIPGLAGGAIMPDGLVGLIIDIGGLLDMVSKARV